LGRTSTGWIAPALPGAPIRSPRRRAIGTGREFSIPVIGRSWDWWRVQTWLVEWSVIGGQPRELQRSAMSRQGEGVRLDGFASKRQRRQGGIYRVRPTMAGTSSAKGRVGSGSTYAALIKGAHYRTIKPG